MSDDVCRCKIDPKRSRLHMNARSPPLLFFWLLDTSLALSNEGCRSRLHASQQRGMEGRKREERVHLPCRDARLAIVYQFLPTRKLSAKSRLATPPSAGLKTGGRGLHDDRCYQPFLSSVLAVYINPFIRRRSVASAAD